MSGMHFISDLKPKKSTWKIKVKVIRFWKQNSAADGETIEMVFVDAKLSCSYSVYDLRLNILCFHIWCFRLVCFLREKIHALIERDLVSQFDPLMKEWCSKLLFAVHSGQPIILIRLVFFLQLVSKYVKISRIMSWGSNLSNIVLF